MSGGSTITALGKSAQSSGLGSTSVGTITASCPLTRAKLAKKGFIEDKAMKPLEYCDIKQLVVTLTPSGEAAPATVIINRDRTGEPVNAAVVDDAYIGDLASFDVVMEAVAEIEDLHAINYGATAGSAGHAVPLKIRGQATNSVSHSSQSPLHPHCSVQGDVRTIETHGGAAAETALLIPRSGGSWGKWADLWPFSTGAEKHYVVADSCGSLPIPRRANRAFLAQVVVYPAQEIALSITGEKRYGVSQGKSKNLAQPVGAKGASIYTATTQTLKIEQRGKTSSMTSVVSEKNKYASYKLSVDGDNGTNETITETTFKDDYTESRTLSVKEDVTVFKGKIGSRTYSTTSGDSTTGKVPDQVEKRKFNFSDRISLKVKSGGQEATIKPSEIVDTFFSIVEAIEDFRKIFSGVQMGFKVDASFTFMQGTLNIAAGRRWPKTLAYAEDQRVWYIERYVNVGGKITFAEGMIAASIGIAFDKGYLPIGGKIMASISYTLSLSAEPKVELCYTNSKRKSKGELTTSVPLKVTSSFKFEAVAMYRAFGDSFCGIIAMKGDIVLAGTLNFSVRKSPSLIVSAKSTGLILTGYWERTGATPERKAFEPVVLADPAVIWPEQDLFAREPAKT